MGQFYNILIGDAMGNNKELYNPSVKCADGKIVYDGDKLMEHSYVDTAFTMGLASMLINHPKRIVWVGDYADEVAWGDELFLVNPKVWADKPNVDIPTYHEAWPCDNSERSVNEAFCFSWEGLKLINHDKKVYVDMETYIRNNTVKVGKWLVSVSPLSLLTAVGNGRGSGDYRGTDMDKVGKWAWNLIEFSKSVPDGYEELTLGFKEG